MIYFNLESKNILKLAEDTAKMEKRKTLTIQQFYLSSLRNTKIEDLLNKMNVDLKKLKTELKNEISKINNIDKNIKYKEDKNSIDFSTILLKFIKEISIYYKNKVDLMITNNISENHALIEPYDLILFLFTLNKSDQQELEPAFFIQKLIYKCSSNSSLKNYKYEDFVLEVNEICSSKMKEKLKLKQDYVIKKTEEKQSKELILEDFAVNLNELYKKGVYTTNVIERENSILELEKILSRKNKNNAILIGDNGVGKSAIIELLVSKICKNEVPDNFKNSTVWSLSLSKLISGTKYRGDFEKRMNMIISELKSKKNSILFIDNIEQILNSDSNSQGVNLSNLIQPALSDGLFKCIGTIGFKEYSKSFSNEKSLSRKFQKVIIKEPSNEMTLKILKSSKNSYQDFHKVIYSDDILEKIVKLSKRYIHNRKFPDKAIDLLDETGALYSSKQKEGKKVTENDILEVISKQANIKLVNEKEEINKLKHLEKSLNNKVLGQEEAIKKLTNAVYSAKAGLNNPKKPYGTFLFLGPTGVGKTEITLQLGKELGMKVHRFDMSEFSEDSSVSKLIGTPPGYIGHDEEGQLTGAVDKEPYSIILFDEIEKASKKIYNTLLQVLDNGFLTDSKGKHVSFRNTIIILTSNAGATIVESKKIGFSNNNEENGNAIDLNAMNDIFSPEFRNRLSSIVTFDYLNEKTILKIVDKFIIELEGQIKEKNVKLTLTPAAKKWLMDKGYNKKMGARPMERAINDNIKQALSYEILFGKLSNGGKVKIGKKDDELTFTYN